MRTAQRLLRQVRGSLSGKAQTHVEKAIEEISVGLSDKEVR
jgi:hypothetical protein